MVEKRTMRDICTGDDSLGTEFVLAADCDAYEARIAELEASKETAYRNWTAATNALSGEIASLRAELARVKAESLRVVECECQDMNISSDWYMTPSGLGWLGYDKHDVERVETPDGYHQFADCKKVRLVPLEDVG